MAKIYTPNKAYTGVSASVPFVNGVGECANPVLLDWFREHGYQVEEPKEDKKPPKEPKEVKEDKKPPKEPKAPAGKSENTPENAPAGAQKEGAKDA